MAMAHAHAAPQSFMNILPVSAVVMNEYIADRLAGTHIITAASHAKKLLSHGFTVILVAISLLGFYEIAGLLSPAGRAAPVTKPAVTASAAAPAVKPSGALARSVPTALSIPSIGVSANIVSVGLNSDGSLEVPGPYDVGWYKLGPSPGETGPAVLVGHVDYATVGAAVFWSLRDMQPGDSLQIARADGSTVTFKVEKVQTYSQDAFPTQEVYGNLDYPGLRVITCTGKFNYVTHSYSDNLVVYARAQL